MKKKLFSLIIACMLILNIIPVHAQTQTYEMGDVNKDGTVSLSDAQVTLRAALAITQLSEDAEKLADVNYDTKVTLSDAQIVLKAALAIAPIPEKPADSSQPEATDEPTETTPDTVEPEETVQITEIYFVTGTSMTICLEESGHNWGIYTKTTEDTKLRTQWICQNCGSIYEELGPLPEEVVIEEPDCIENKEHNYVWTHVTENDSDYKIMKCTHCRYETGTRAENLGKGVYGYYDEEAADELLMWVNSQRHTTTTNITDIWGNSLGVTKVPPLIDELEDIAKLRAVDAADYVLSGTTSEYRTDNECISLSSTSPVGAYHAFSTSTMVQIDYTKGSCATLWYDTGNGNMKAAWVLVLNYE